MESSLRRPSVGVAATALMVVAFCGLLTSGKYPPQHIVELCFFVVAIESDYPEHSAWRT